METPEDYFAALTNILRDPIWNSKVEHFLCEYTTLFELPPDGAHYFSLLLEPPPKRSIGEFGHGHFDIWNDFRALCEAQLNKVLAEVQETSNQNSSFST